jgi:hypothetical protein
MATRFLELDDGVIVEIGGPDDAREEMHTSTAERVDTTMEIVGTMLRRILAPIGDAFNGLQQSLAVPIELSEAEVEIGLSFSAEGNLFVAKSKAEGTLHVKVSFRPAGDATERKPTGGARP